MSATEQQRAGSTQRHASKPSGLPSILEQISEQAEDAIFAFDREYRVLYLNRAAERTTGASSSKIVGHLLHDLLPAELFASYVRNSEEVFRTKKPATFTEIINGPHGPRHFESHKFPLFNDDGEVFAVGCIATDIENRIISHKDLELARSRTLHASKLAWLAEMASGISHEINNPLTVIMGMAARLRDEANRGFIDAQTVSRTSDKIERMVQRISYVVTSLRDISRDAETDPFMPIQMRWLVDRALALSLSNAALGCGGVRLGEIPEDVFIECRHIQITQALVHILLNARDAIRESNVKHIELRFLDLGDAIELRVTDSGPGVPSELKEKIFDPFFTTKNHSQSSGLGLTMARRMCDIHGGSLVLDSSIEGTSFILRLPKRQARRN